jgi:hypothetical protein
MAFFLVIVQFQPTTVSKENDEGIISGISEFPCHPCDQVTWWFSLVKQLEHSEPSTGFFFSIHQGLGMYSFISVCQSIVSAVTCGFHAASR